MPRGWLEKAEDEGGEDRGQDGVQCHAEAGEGAGDRVHLKGAGGADAMACDAGREAAGAPVLQTKGIQNRCGDHRARDAGEDHQDSRQGGRAAKVFRNADSDGSSGGFGCQRGKQGLGVL